MFQVNPLLGRGFTRNIKPYFLRKIKEKKCRLLQFLPGALRVNYFAFYTFSGGHFYKYLLLTINHSQMYLRRMSSLHSCSTGARKRKTRGPVGPDRSPESCDTNGILAFWTFVFAMNLLIVCRHKVTEPKWLSEFQPGLVVSARK